MRYIKSSGEIKSIRSQGHAVKGRYLTMVAIVDRAGVAVVAGRSVGGAVARNKARRRLKSYFNQREGWPWSSLAIMVMCKNGADRVNYQILVNELEGLLQDMDKWYRGKREV